VVEILKSIVTRNITESRITSQRLGGLYP
jgi:hypothetical protein